MGTLAQLSKILDEAKSEYAAVKGCGFENANITKGNIIALGDNVSLLKKLSDELEKKASFDGFDFIYIDPPFYSGEDYKANINIGDENLKFTVYGDKWKSLGEFLEMLSLRLYLIKDVLKDTGLVALHLDTHAAAYAKVLLDEIFGEEHFVNELIWSYKSGGARGKCFAKKHDTILVYSKTDDYYFLPKKEISYNRDGRPYRFKGVEEYQDEEGKWYTLVNRKDVINVDMVGRTSSERTGYATQKPERLIEILLESFCKEGGLAGDFFAGSGTLAAACNTLGVNYIICDRSPVAFGLSKNRLEKSGSSFDVIKQSDIDIEKELASLNLEEDQLGRLREILKL